MPDRALKCRDVRLVRVVQNPPLRHALEYLSVDFTRALDRGLVGVEQTEFGKPALGGATGDVTVNEGFETVRCGQGSLMELATNYMGLELRNPLVALASPGSASAAAWGRGCQFFRVS